MTAETLSPIRRPHTVLGVCEAIGEDFGFNPLVLRIAFAAGLFFSPMWVIASYLGLGAIVAVSRWVSPVPTMRPAPAIEIEEEDEPLRLAA